MVNEQRVAVVQPTEHERAPLSGGVCRQDMARTANYSKLYFWLFLGSVSVWGPNGITLTLTLRPIDGFLGSRLPLFSVFQFYRSVSPIRQDIGGGFLVSACTSSMFCNQLTEPRPRMSASLRQPERRGRNSTRLDIQFSQNRQYSIFKYSPVHDFTPG